MRDILTTERLILRPLLNSDARAYTENFADWDLARMTGSFPYPLPLLSAEIKVMMLNAQKRRGLAHPYAVTENGKEMIGVMDLFRRSDAHDYELGYWIGRAHWGKGYAKEAAEALLTEAQKSLGVEVFVAGVFADNPASMRVLEKLGFENTGSEGDYYCMARLQHMESIGFRLHRPLDSLKSLPA